MMNSSSVSGVDLMEREKEDRITELPEDIIVHILSFLNAEDAVRSSVISRQFAGLWTYIPRLRFVGVNLTFINNALRIRKSSNLHGVSVENCHYPTGHPHSDRDFDQFIRLLSTSNAKDLSLGLEGFGFRFVLPSYFYSNSGLRKLTLTSCRIKTNGVVNWKSLQSLCIGHTVLRNDTIRDILSGCPSLELFNLSYCAGFTLIDITNNRYLEKLTIDYFKGDIATVKILVPNLHSLILSHSINCAECKAFIRESC